jgi:TRAP transporter 4TM/12TM fusion protein
MKGSVSLETKASGERLACNVVLVISCAACLFHLYTGAFGVYTAFKQRLIHLALIGTVGLLTAKKSRERNFIDWAFSAVLLAAMAYFLLDYSSFIQRTGNFTQVDLAMGALLLLAVLYMTLKNLGWPIVIIALIALTYAFFGNMIPGKIGHKGFSLQRLLSHLTLGTEGILGSPMGASATFVIVFIIMAGFLDKSGAGDFFINSALACTGRLRGGPAKAAVVASGLFGTISGSSVANVVSTGTFTIPLMKKTGFQPAVAGAVEAVASTGGQLMPPIMGAGAFVMAEITGIPYSTIMVAAIMPALLYYCSIYFCVDNYSAKNNMKGAKPEDLPDLRKEFNERGHMLIPLIRKSPQNLYACKSINVKRGLYTAKSILSYMIGDAM